MDSRELICVCVCGKGCSLYARDREALPSQ